jgi:AcrR family transcriptional regulator
MQQRLSEAAFDVIREGGYANFRTSSVSKRAGVSQGAQLHHYPTKNSLAVAALEYAYDKSHQEFEENYARRGTGTDLLDLIFKDFIAFYLSDYFKVALDILMAGGKNEELHNQVKQMTQESRRKIERSWLEELVDAGWSLTLAEDILALTHSIIRGHGIRALVMDDEFEFDRLMKRWRKMVDALAPA